MLDAGPEELAAEDFIPRCQKALPCPEAGEEMLVWIARRPRRRGNGGKGRGCGRAGGRAGRAGRRGRGHLALEDVAGDDGAEDCAANAESDPESQSEHDEGVNSEFDPAEGGDAVIGPDEVCHVIYRSTRTSDSPSRKQPSATSFILKHRGFA